ncbi:MAG: Hsp20/alpha crystallin family protein [Anaerolineae bacterium]
MPITDLMPWRKRERTEPERAETSYPIQDLQESMNRLFDRFFEGTWMAPSERLGERWAEFSPRMDIAETDDAVEVTFELPGLDEDDIDVSISHNMLTVSGEKSSEREERKRNYYRMERSYGSFRRTVPLPAEVNPDEAEANLKKGLLTVTLPKTEEARSRKKITVKRESE